MSGLKLDDIHKHFGTVVAVQQVNLLIPHGRFVCFLGPSGCGKTTLLRLIAGLEHPTRGRIVLDERRHHRAARPTGATSGWSSSRSPCSRTSRSGRTSPTACKIRKADDSARRRRVDELLELVRMPGYAGRHISQLSGGQRQRVAIARALAIEPRLFLLDEPLSALDAKLREDMQLELRMLQQRLGVTTILVTHDQREAMTMSDLIVVMGPDNQVHQMGTPLEIYRHPADTFVADFIGTSNLLKGVCRGSGRVAVGESLIRAEAVPGSITQGSAVVISVRPEEITVVPGVKEGDNHLKGTVTFVRDVGSNVEIYLDCGGFQIISQSTPKSRPAVRQGEAATAVLPPAACVVLTS